MPVLTKEKLKNIKRELNARYSVLAEGLSSRELKNNKEGAGSRRHWGKPDIMAATVADDMQLRLLVEDFKAILAEIKRLK